MSNLIESIISWALSLISKFGYGGIFFTMMLESMGVPIPSEVVVPFGGFLASSGELNFWFVVFSATVANLVGSIIFYWVGWLGGRSVIDRYGKYILIHRGDIEKTESWIKKYGTSVAFFSRLLPGVRTFSSIVLGTAKLNLKKFFWFTLVGSFLWNLPLAYVGLKAGDNWNLLRPYFHKFDGAIVALVAIGIILFIFRHVHKSRQLKDHPDLNS